MAAIQGPCRRGILPRYLGAVSFLHTGMNRQDAALHNTCPRETVALGVRAAGGTIKRANW